MQESFMRELMESGYVHFPLPLHAERSLEQENHEKKVRHSRSAFELQAAVLKGRGTLYISENNRQETVLRVTGPNGRMAAAGLDYMDARQRAELIFPVTGEDWQGFDRISFYVKPSCDGSHSVHFRMHIKNEGEHPIPDPYFREGQSLVNLSNHEWNHVIWEFSSLYRDRITEFSISVDSDGQDLSTGEEFDFAFRDFELQSTGMEQKEYGWDCEEGHVAYSMSGYDVRYSKKAIAPFGITEFTLEDQTGRIILQKKAEQICDDRFRAAVLDFSEIEEPGRYRICAGDIRTEWFDIGENILETPIWKIINFIFCERCGYPVPGKHGRCHTDVIAKHEGKVLSYGGGWHDAGDMSQQMLQTAEVTQELLELSVRTAGDHPLLSSRLLEEGLWGLDFTLRSRFGDGFRASSVGLGQWTAGYIGDEDDVEVRVHDQAFQNYYCAAIEAQAALVLKSSDPDLAWKCIESAKEDYRFAKKKFLEKGMELPVMWEHTLNSGLSQYYAAAVWACASICQYEENEEFAAEAIRIGGKLLACQETGTEGVPLRGFFYRDESHRTIVHFTHQGRDHSFVQAIEALCRAFPNAKEKAVWEDALRLYGEYIKSIYELASPYGMLPAGIHSITEVEDGETFPLLHLLTEYDQEKENYKEQLKSGIDLGGGYYLRMFPVWFSFRGNNAILLSMAKGAAIIGRYLGDEKLQQIAMEQLYWTLGKNPFCQSLMYGEGYRYAQQDANYPGEMTGELPVGIQTRDNEDIPYWPSGNNATYKEVWLTPAGRWLSVAAELYPDR